MGQRAPSEIQSNPRFKSRTNFCIRPGSNYIRTPARWQQRAMKDISVKSLFSTKTRRIFILKRMKTGEFLLFEARMLNLLLVPSLAVCDWSSRPLMPRPFLCCHFFCIFPITLLPCRLNTAHGFQ